MYPLILPAPNADLLGSPVHPAGRYRTLGQEESLPPAPGADMPGTPDPRGAIAIWARRYSAQDRLRSPDSAGLISD